VGPGICAPGPDGGIGHRIGRDRAARRYWARPNALYTFFFLGGVPVWQTERSESQSWDSPADFRVVRLLR
jgi:hypothetical protein